MQPQEILNALWGAAIRKYEFDFGRSVFSMLVDEFENDTSGFRRHHLEIAGLYSVVCSDARWVRMNYENDLEPEDSIEETDPHAIFELSEVKATIIEVENRTLWHVAMEFGTNIPIQIIGQQIKVDGEILEYPTSKTTH